MLLMVRKTVKGRRYKMGTGYLNGRSDLEMRSGYFFLRAFYGYKGKYQDFKDAMLNAKEPINPDNVKQASEADANWKRSNGTSELFVQVEERAGELGLLDKKAYQQTMERLRQRSKKDAYMSIEGRGISQSFNLSQAFINSKWRTVSDLYERNMF
jgi:hypothetical protein